ncbi:EamA family transporter [Candidatus Woesearchaeota archaeon]|nr:EamA family transporter [Candidatus Woesearchaeota archaeon]
MVDMVAFVLVLFGSIIGAFGALELKRGADKFSFFKLWKSFSLWTGLVLYGASVFFYVFALRREELSVVYPLVSTTYIWITLLSMKFLGEKLNKWKVFGLIGIICGLILIGVGS